MLIRRILSTSVHSVAFWRRKTHILPFFGLGHFVMWPIGGVQRKLNADTQLRTFPYPTISKPMR